MKIINKTKLSYKEIGSIIDTIINSSQGDTHYYGQVQYTTCEIENNITIKIQIRYLKRYTEWLFVESER